MRTRAGPFATTMPSAAGLAGIALGTQALILDPGATNPVGASMTDLAAGRAGN